MPSFLRNSINDKCSTPSLSQSSGILILLELGLLLFLFSSLIKGKFMTLAKATIDKSLLPIVFFLLRLFSEIKSLYFSCQS